MNATIINNSKSNVQVYAMCSDNIGTVNLKDIFSGDITFIGDGSNADVTILNNCSGKKYIIVQVWRADDSKAVNTVAVYDIGARQIIANELRSFTISVNTDPKGTMITINDNPNSIWRFILIGLGILILIALLILIGYFIMRYFKQRRSSGSNIYYGQEDVPILFN